MAADKRGRDSIESSAGSTPSPTELTKGQIVREQYLTEKAEAKDKEENPKTAFSSLWNRKKEKRDPEEIATQPSVFDDPDLGPYFEPSEHYENKHRFDPSFRWTWAEENVVIRRLDWKVTSWAALAFFALDIDRGNISQANTDNFLDDLGLTTNDFNTGRTIFLASFLSAELPSQLISKKLGPDRWIPSLMCMWSIVCTCQFWLSGRTSFFATRAIIGALQGGFIPDTILYMSYFFKGTELPIRMAFFYLSSKMTDVVAPLMAFGLLRMRGVLGYSGWRWLFLVEGILTLLIGIFSWFCMVPSPTQSKAFWRPKGWFTEHQEKILVNRILRDDPTKSDMHNRQAITFKLLWESFCDYDMWPMYLIGLSYHVPSKPPDQYLTLTLRSLGFDTFESNLLSIPCQVITAAGMVLIIWISEKINQRSYMGIFIQVWWIPCFIALVVLPSSASRWATYAIVTTILSYPYLHPLMVAWASRNSGSVKTRTISAAVFNMTAQINSIIASNIYRADDKPEYRRGNTVLACIAGWNIVAYLLLKWYYSWRNKTRQQKWDAMTTAEKEEYLRTTRDTGNRRLDFRFVH